MNRVHTGAYILLTLSLVLLGYSFAENRKQEIKLKEQESRSASLSVQLEMERRKSAVLDQQKTRVVVVTKPDGTRIETREDTKSTQTTQTDTRIAQNEQTQEQIQKRTETEVKSKLARYSVTPEWRGLGPYGMPTGASVGVRLGNLPLWGVGGWDLRGGAHIGLRIEW